MDSSLLGRLDMIAKGIGHPSSALGRLDTIEMSRDPGTVKFYR